jgi:glycosyltransferase involved in cell wall biosynthesis
MMHFQTSTEMTFNSKSNQTKEGEQPAVTALKSHIDHADVREFKKDFSTALRSASRLHGFHSALNLIKQLEVSSGLRKPSLAIYDNCLHFIGGGQKYGMTLASALQDIFDITILANQPVSHEDILKWYDLDLRNCSFKIIPIPFYQDKASMHLDPALVLPKTQNPFHAISLESARYDFFLNNSMLEMVYPLSNISVMMVHFPERRPRYYFYSDAYTFLMYNSQYTASWIRKKWKLDPQQHIYPPVDMEVYNGVSPKKNIIISVARFEEGGTKKQIEMIRAFVHLQELYPDITSGWQLILVGGSNPDNPYLRSVNDSLKTSGNRNINLEINISANKLKDLYRDAKIFWHLCGLGQNDPAKIEHFGMTICESMQNNLVPIVFDGGGQREIVDHGINGFRVSSISQLIRHTVQLIRDPEKLKYMGSAARLSSKAYDKPRFIREVREFFNRLLSQYIIS